MAAPFPVAYREDAPPPGLAPWVECLWWRSAGDAPAPASILPDGRIDLIWTPAGDVLLAGPQTRPLDVPFGGPFLAVGARFHPGAAPALLRVPARELRDAHVPCDAVDARLAAEVRTRLAPARTRPQALDALAGVLARRCAELAPPDPLLRGAVALLGSGPARVADVADAAAISERQLQRRFDAWIGYGPKTLARVLRFQRATRLLSDAAGAPDLARVAAVAGYADQAHLTRESRALAGLTPVQLGRRLVG
ncbi:MAG TPA: helix-turn-helix domain-containing protein [Conexibacter sp.]